MVRRLKTRWNEFFHAREVPYGMALVRISLPLVLLIGAIPRWWHVRELYSLDGSPSPLWVSYGTTPFLPILAAPVAVALFSVLILSLCAVSVGWMTRLSLIVSCILYAGFGLLDAMGTLTKYTVVATHLMVILSLSECGAVWSVDAWLRRRSQPATQGIIDSPKSSVWTLRLLQLFVGIVYLGAAITKMHTPAYFSGDQLTFWMLGNTNLENRLGETLTLYPWLLAIMAYITIIWEVLFVFLVYSKVWRVPTLVIGLIFHVLTYYTLGLIIFPLMFIATYFAFIEPHEAERMAVWARNALRRVGLTFRRRPSLRVPRSFAPRPAYAAAAWCMMMATGAVIGVEVEHHRDVYHKRGENGPLPLKVMDSQLVHEMLGPAKPIRPKDLYFAFDVGSSNLGGVLSNRRDTFSYGERALIQCSLHPPHPDMWVEVNLHDADDVVLKRVGTIVPREDLRAEFFYDMKEPLLPGEYDFVLKYDGEELTRRRVTLQGQPPELTASR
ncbi:MAG: HTTM domain-containing protein [Planctomycetaceae bacterium]|nr:HTTM domain-containing protein [Planctomycetaceae bacterium]